MRILKCVLVIGAILFALVAGAAPQDKESVAPFGLEWGMSTAQVKGLGVDLAERPEKEFGQTYTATKVPKILSDVALVVLSFGYDDKLWRIVAVSKNFDNDPYGSAVQSRYDELARLLGEKYGPGKQNQPSDGLVIHVNPRRDEQNGVPRLVIEGEVINSATVALPVPQLKVELKDAGQHVVQTWTFAASTDRLLPGASVPFTTSVERPNEAATSMSVSFVDEEHQ